MVIGTYRPVEVIVSEHPLHFLKQDLMIHQLCREIALEPLGEAVVAEYLVAKSSGASLPDGLASLLYQHSEANPMFMVTALNDMTERGLISRDEESWQLRVSLKGIDLEVPTSLRQMIEVQIDRLIPEEKRVLEVASLESVERSRFGVVSRAQVIDMDPEVFEGVCETLSRRHCIVLAMVRKLAVRLYWMMRKEWNYDQVIIRFARGTARKSRWCAVEHRVIDWAFRCREESETVIMIEVVDRRDAWVGSRISDQKMIASEPWLVWH
jgi:hypothetical protein